MSGNTTGGIVIELSARQSEILKLVQARAPITGDQIAEELGVSRPTLRSDLALLVMLGHLDAKPKVGYFPGAARGNEPRLSVQGLTVRDVQGLPVVVRETTTIGDAVVTMFIENVGGLIVCGDSGLLMGVVSRKDLLKVTVGNPSVQTMPVSMVMTRKPNVITVSPDDDVLEAARKMIHHQVDSLPVVVPAQVSDKKADPELEVVGRITKTTMLKLLLRITGA